jgi:hypothetical protein
MGEQLLLVLAIKDDKTVSTLNPTVNMKAAEIT